LEKINVVLVALNNDFLDSAIKNLNFDNANLLAVVTDSDGEEFLKLGEKQIPLVSFPALRQLAETAGDAVWSVVGCINDGGFRKARKFLAASGVSENNIINFEPVAQINPRQLANLRYVEENGADFFATGGSCFEVGLDLNRIPHVEGRGINLSCNGQTLRQSYWTAKRVFEHVPPGTIKFVLIGLEPNSFLRDAEADARERLLPNLIGDGVKNILSTTIAAQADLNFNDLKAKFNYELNAKAILDWDDAAQFSAGTGVDEGVQTLEDYINLCRDNGAKPVVAVFPFAAVCRKNYNAELLATFRATLNRLHEQGDLIFIDLFDLNLDDDCFADMSHLNLKGATQVSALLGAQLYFKNVIVWKNVFNMPVDYFGLLANNFTSTYEMLIKKLFITVPFDKFKTLSKVLPGGSYGALMENFLLGMSYDRFKKLSAADGDALLDRLLSKKTYKHFFALAELLPKDEYNALIARTLKLAVQRIRRKSKIKLGFVLYSASMWCGDEIYNSFARDDRFETTFFFCLKRTNSQNEFVQADYWQGVERFKEHGLNVVTVTERNPKIPAQDVLIFLTPYYGELPKIFQAPEIKMTTLFVNIPYTLDVSNRPAFLDSPFFYVLWKMFFPSKIALELQDKTCRVGMPRGIYSGYPKMDIFFQNVDFNFEWKMARPDAKKIIWAPHHSITDKGVCYANFRWNHQFMYEFAKAHPEISWIVKPHPYLHHSAVVEKVFPSVEAVKEYFQKWDDLPNARVYTGAYYQAIFATSDGMIQDSASFLAEYQYVDKPMIYLTREGGKFNELGKMILSVSYCVDGKDLLATAALMQKVFIDGIDDKAAERRKLFDEQLNYPKHNGMTASEFIYKSIADELKEASK